MVSLATLVAVRKNHRKGSQNQVCESNHGALGSFVAWLLWMTFFLDFNSTTPRKDQQVFGKRRDAV